MTIIINRHKIGNMAITFKKPLFLRFQCGFLLWLKRDMATSLCGNEKSDFFSRFFR